MFPSSSIASTGRQKGRLGSLDGRAHIGTIARPKRQSSALGGSHVEGPLNFYEEGLPTSAETVTIGRFGLR